jgi:hypothetical protein
MRPFHLIFISLLFSSQLAFAQSNGINFQGIARNASGEPLVNQKITLRFAVIQSTESGTVEYQETKEATSNGQGMFSVVIGDGVFLTKTGNFTDINWKLSPKFLKVELDPQGGTNFAVMGTSRLQAVPFAYYANGVDAENVQGVLPAAKGGTGVASITALKGALQLDQVSNTSDANKPLSTAAQTALATKVDKVQGKDLSTNDFTTAEKTKLAAITGTNTGDQDLSGLATTTALATKANTTDVTTALANKVDKVQGKELSTNDYTTAEKTKLAAITGTNTGDQDLSGYATTAALNTKANSSEVTTALATKANASDVTTALATKVDKVQGKDLSTNDFTTAEKTKLAAITGTNTGDQDLSGYATTSALALKENATNKSSATDLGSNTTSDVLFPTQKAVKTYVDAQVATGGIQDGSIQTRHLANEAVNGSKLATEISGYKKFLNGAGGVTLSSTILTDVDVNSGLLAVGGTSNWQSFTAGTSGKLTVVEFQTINPSSGGPAPVAYVEIYNGQGISGSLLGTSTPITISGMGRNWYAFDLGSTSINLISGNSYTARLVVNTTNQNYVYGDNALYNGGVSNISPTWDLNIKTKIRQYNDDVFLTTSTANSLYGGLVSNATHTGEVTGATTLTITDGAVTASKIASGAVDLTSKVSGLLPTGNIADGAITTAKLANNAVDLATKVTGALPSANLADGAVTSAKIGIGAVNLSTQVTGTLSTASLADGAVTTAKLGINSVDLTTKVTGTLPTANIADGAVTSPKIGAGAVNLSTQVSGTLATSNLADGAVTTAKLANNAVDLTTQVTGALPSANLADGAVTTAKLANNAVDLTTKVTGALPAANLADGAITTAKLANNAVDLTTKVTGALPGTNLADGGITTAKLANNAVDLTTKVTGALPSANLADGAVTAAKIANNAVSLTSKVTGVLPVGNGGTGASTASANTIFAGPNGSTGAPTFRSLVVADLPSLSSSYIANTSTAQTANFNISGNGVIGGSLEVNGITLGKGAGNGFTNTALGLDALVSNTSGQSNTAIGYLSMSQNTTGNNNLAIGSQSLYSNNTGFSNLAIGNGALSRNTTGGNNTAIGLNSLNDNSSGNQNIAIGENSLKGNTTGFGNVSIGLNSMYGYTTGSQNTAIGVAAGFSFTARTGDNNLILGYNAQPSTSTVSNEVTLGNSFITSLRAQVTSITSLSDRRDKTNIVPIAEGLDFIKQLKPVTFTWDTRDKAKVGIKSAGFIAQDLLALQKASAIGENLDLVSENNPEKLEARYANLLPVMVKAMQEQQAIIEQLKLEIEALKKLVKE